MDATGAENHTTILVIEPSPVEKDMLWVGTDDGRVHFTQNGGQTWTDVAKNIKGLPEGSWIPQIKASNKNKGEALLVANDYRRFNYTPYVYRTKDYGKTWTRIVDSNDVESFALAILEDLEEQNLMFLGTDDGLYVSIDAGNKWTKWGKGFPTTSVKDLVIHPREHDIVIGTFGRAAWVIDDIRPLREIAKNKSTLTNKLTLFNPPTAYQAAYQQPTGSRFGADAMYNGDNRSRGAIMSYFVKIDDKKKDMPKADDSKNKKGKKSKNEAEEKPAQKAESKIKWDSITMKIYDGNRLIRTLKRKAPKETGVHKWTWGMREKGGDRPSRAIRPRRGEPGGVGVKPGTYKVVMNFGDQTSETNITVASDPRLDVDMNSINEVYNASKEVESITQVAADAVKQLVESKNIATEYSKLLAKLDKETHKDNIKASKDIAKRIDEVLELYLGKVDRRQGITSDPNVNVMQRVFGAASYIRSRKSGITSTERTLMKNAKDALDDALEKTNTFFNDEWSPYKASLENLSLSPFKDVKSFKLD